MIFKVMITYYYGHAHAYVSHKWLKGKIVCLGRSCGISFKSARSHI